jgi:hypothetical protein
MSQRLEKHEEITSMSFSAHLRKWSKWTSVIALVALLAGSQASAEENFKITIIHNINGTSLGLDKDLPVDIYVNGANAIQNVTFRQTIETMLEAGTYTFEVKLAGTSTTVMSFGPAEVPAGAYVTARARLGSGKTPFLDVKVR